MKSPKDWYPKHYTDIQNGFSFMPALFFLISAYEGNWSKGAPFRATKLWQEQMVTESLHTKSLYLVLLSTKIITMSEKLRLRGLNHLTRTHSMCLCKQTGACHLWLSQWPTRSPWKAFRVNALCLGYMRPNIVKIHTYGRILMTPDSCTFPY